MRPAFTSFRPWVAPSAGCATLFGMIKNSTKSFGFAGRLSWSPDGKLLAYSDHASRGEGASIFLLSLDSLDVRRLTSPTRSSGDFNPEFSPDGHTLAFARVSQGSVNLSRSQFREERNSASSPYNRSKRGLAWTPDGRELVFANVDGLWKISLVAESRNDCSSVKTELNLRLEVTD